MITQATLEGIPLNCISTNVYLNEWRNPGHLELWFHAGEGPPGRRQYMRRTFFFFEESYTPWKLNMHRYQTILGISSSFIMYTTCRIIVMTTIGDSCNCNCWWHGWHSRRLLAGFAAHLQHVVGYERSSSLDLRLGTALRKRCYHVAIRSCVIGETRTWIHYANKGLLTYQSNCPTAPTLWVLANRIIQDMHPNRSQSECCPVALSIDRPLLQKINIAAKFSTLQQGTNEQSGHILTAGVLWSLRPCDSHHSCCSNKSRAWYEQNIKKYPNSLSSFFVWQTSGVHFAQTFGKSLLKIQLWKKSSHGFSHYCVWYFSNQMT